jgi:hypothetical protein
MAAVYVLYINVQFEMQGQTNKFLAFSNIWIYNK